MPIKVCVSVAVYRSDRSVSHEQVEFRDTLVYDEWDVVGLGRILRRVKRSLDAERRIAKKS